MSNDKPRERPRYYDVEKFRRVYQETLKTRKGFSKIIGRVTWYIDSVQGFFVATFGAVIAFGAAIAVIIGVYYGPLVFLGIFISLIGGFGFVLDKKVGRSLQFGDYKFWRKLLAQTLAFLVALGLLMFLVLLSRVKPF